MDVQYDMGYVKSSGPTLTYRRGRPRHFPFIIDTLSINGQLLSPSLAT